MNLYSTPLTRTLATTLITAVLSAALPTGAISPAHAAPVEHCGGAIEVTDLEPNTPQLWPLGGTGVISWLIGDGCGPLTYEIEISRNGEPFQMLATTGPHRFNGRVEFAWPVTGTVGDQVVFKVYRSLPDRVVPEAFTPSIEIAKPVPTGSLSWSALRARY